MHPLPQRRSTESLSLLLNLLRWTAQKGQVSAPVRLIITKYRALCTLRCRNKRTGYRVVPQSLERLLSRTVVYEVRIYASSTRPLPALSPVQSNKEISLLLLNLSFLIPRLKHDEEIPSFVSFVTGIYIKPPSQLVITLHMSARSPRFLHLLPCLAGGTAGGEPPTVASAYPPSESC